MALAVGGGRPAGALAIGVDEYQKYLYEVRSDARLALFRLADGAPQREFVVAGLEGATLTAAARSLSGDQLALGTSDGRAALAQMRFRPVFEAQLLKDVDAELRVKRVMAVDPQQRPIRDVATQLTAEGESLVASLVGDDEIVLARLADAAEGELPPEPALETLRSRGGEKLTHVRLGRASLVAATDSGQLYYWELGSAESRLTDVVQASRAPLTAVEVGLGGNSVIVGDREGGISAWFRARAQLGGRPRRSSRRTRTSRKAPRSCRSAPPRVSAAS